MVECPQPGWPVKLPELLKLDHLTVRTRTPYPSPRSWGTQLRQRTLAAAGDDRSTPRGRPGRGRGRGLPHRRRRPRRPQPLPPYLGPPLDPLNKPHHEGRLEPWTKRIYNDDYECCYKIKNNLPKDVSLPTLPLPIAL